MSDPMRRPPVPPGPPMDGGVISPTQRSTEDVLKENRSIFNPADMAMAAKEGVTDMSIRQFFEMNNIDVDGPVTQMIDFVKDQKQKASGQGKMQALANSQPPPNPLDGAGPPPGGAPPGGAPPTPGQNPLDRLMQ